jgi:Ca2+-binding RTX toxin-like protein
VIHALDPSRMPSGTFERLIDVTGRLPDPGVVAETATISGLPEGFAINNATQSGDKWVVQLSKFDPNHFQIELRYVLPAEGTAPDANGILGDFTLNVTFKTHDSKGGLHLYAGTQIFVTREIGSEADVTASANGVGKMYALNATPPGTEISACEGNDSVYAGPGHDTLDGGSGANLVSYAESSSGVMVDLFTGQGQGGYATGDVLRNFSSIEGSAFADRLLGTAGDNNFYGHGGADTIIGNGGHDIVYFDASQEAVSVNLETGEVSGGPGSGILLTFAFSAVMAFIFISKLNNEIVAFKALREMWDDIQLGSMERPRAIRSGVIIAAPSRRGSSSGRDCSATPMNSSRRNSRARGRSVSPSRR